MLLVDKPSQGIEEEENFTKWTCKSSSSSSSKDD